MRKKTITEALAMLSESYQGRFVLTADTERIWSKLLCDIGDEHVLTAVLDWCTTGEKFPPTIPEIRERAINIGLGELAPPTSFEAWERVNRALHDETVRLTDLEKKARNQIGGTWQLKTTTNGGYDRGQFVKAYEALTAKERRLKLTLPQVKALAERSAPALPSPASKPLELAATNTAGPEQVGELVKGLAGYRSKRGDA